MLTPCLSLFSRAIYQGRGGFSPAELFANGEQGAWYDPSDLSTLFQDAAGTTPVTSHGDPVGLVLDKSGNGRNLTQSTTAARPVYQTNGTLHWLRFDGSDDFMSTAPVDFSATDEMSVITGITRTNVTTSILLELSENLNTNNGSFYFASPTSGDSMQYSSKGTAQATATGTISMPAVISGISKISTDSVVLRGNGAELATSASNQGAGNYGNYSIYLGRRGGSSLSLQCSVYGMIIRGIITSGDDLANAEQWMAGKTGVSL